MPAPRNSSVVRGPLPLSLNCVPRREPIRRVAARASDSRTLRSMPELPEVERARGLIADRALHRTIVAVDDSDTYVCRPHAPGEIADALVGRELVSAERRGKSMWCETSGDGPALGLHLGMAGRIVVDEDEAGDRVPKHERKIWDRFSVEFADGGRMALRDSRRLGRVRLEPAIEKLGA